MRLGYINNTEIAIVETDRPWALVVDTVVLPTTTVRRGLGAELVEVLGLDPTELQDAIDSGRPVELELQEALPPHWRTVPKRTLHFTDESHLGTQLRQAFDLSSQVAVPAQNSRARDALEVVLEYMHNDKHGPNHHLIRRLVVFYGSEDGFIETMQQAWEELTGEEPHAVARLDRATALQGGVASDLVPPTRSISRWDDKLDVAKYATMLASVITDPATPLPLSIGVFGEWGSGKSYFMGLLRGQVSSMSGDDGRTRKVVPISFNAWHYADADLWASLGDVVFRDLAAAVGAGRRDQRSEIEQKLLDKMDHRGEVEEAVNVAAESAARLSAEIEAARATHVVTAGDLLRSVWWSAELRGRFRRTWRRMGIVDDTERARVLSQELRRSAEDAIEVRELALGRTGRWAIAAAAALLAATAVLVLLAPLLVARITGALGAVMAIGGLGAVVSARNGLSALRVLSTDLRTGMDTAAGKRLESEVQEKVDELRKVEAKQVIAEQQLAELVEEVGQLGARLAEWHPAHRMTAFLADRASSDRYTRNLSTVSTVRKDFEELVDLLARWRKEPGDGAEPIDRIVLYIDDLDRCGPRHVVAVLEAVHLILALDLFVVVVGVDPRWLLRSLSTHHGHTLDDRTLDQWRVSPEDYLEKIINLPFALPRMTGWALRNLYQSETAGQRPTSSFRSTKPEPTYYGGASGNGRTRPAPLIIQPKLALSLDAPTEPEPLLQHEIGQLARLGPLITTPRAAKRLLNIYRVVRSTRDFSDSARFLGADGAPGDFQAVVVLLGILTAAPRIAAEVFANLLAQPSSTTWTEFAVDLGNAGPSEEWQSVCQRLTEISSAVTLPTIEVFKQWVPIVRRFSYLLD